MTRVPTSVHLSTSAQRRSQSTEDRGQEQERLRWFWICELACFVLRTPLMRFSSGFSARFDLTTSVICVFLFLFLFFATTKKKNKKEVHLPRISLPGVILSIVGVVSPSMVR